MNKKTLSGLPAWLLRLLRDGHSHSYTNQALSALRFLHLRVLRAPAPVAGIPRAKRKKTLPVVLSESEVRKFLGALGNRSTVPSSSSSTQAVSG
jgi:integrase